jgi:hypothetical protein
MNNLSIILLALALACFIISAVGNISSKINLVALGLAFLTMSLITNAIQ